MPDAHDLPDAVRRLIDERAEARAARDWVLADALRDRLAELGWEVQDSAAGSTARPILAAADAEPAPDRLDEPGTVPLSVVVVAEDHAADLVRLLRGLAAHPPSTAWEPVIVGNAPSFDLRAAVASIDGLPATPELVERPDRLGWADARTLGLRAARGEVVLLLDTSVEPVGDIAAPLLAAFDDPAVGVAGAWGVVTDDLRHFTDAPPGEVDAVEAYAMAIRRDALRSVGGFDRRYRFYRHADLDLSFAIRDAGWRAVATEPLPLTRHEHRGWAALPDDERERLSRRNFYRFLDRWRGRPDLLVGGGR